MRRRFSLMVIMVGALLSLSTTVALAGGQDAGAGAGAERVNPPERGGGRGQSAAHRAGRDDEARTGAHGRQTAPRNEAAVKVVDREPDDHPSGRDRDTEATVQGRSMSDPDGESNGGMDKPGFTGGYDDDRDFNNGCGNDDDFEDDNNGWCGRKPERIRGEQAEKATETAPATGEATLGATADNSAADDAASQPVPPAVEVKGVTFTRENLAAPHHHSSHQATAVGSDRAEVRGAFARGPEQPAVEAGPELLPRTGLELATLALLGGCLLAGGMVARRYRLTR